ncbi:MAG: Smr/MutS family protein [bacterium]|nr:Smr/MutS family protein [bacterium]
MIFKNTPTLDLHGMDREITKVLVKEFIYDNYRMKNQKVVIIHGKGTGILKKTVHEVLKRDRLVEKFYLDFFNIGSTVVTIKKNG